MTAIEHKIVLQEALQYFKSQPGYETLFQSFRQKYESLGRIGGTVQLRSYSPEAIEAFARFFGLHAEQLLRKGKISLLEFEKKLADTRFGSITLLELLEAYFGEMLVSKKEQLDQARIQQMELLENYKARYPQLHFWLEYIGHRSADALWILRMLGTSEFDSDMVILAKAFKSLPAEDERLPVFAQRVTGNPHTFDLTERLGRLWIHLLHVHRKSEEMPSSLPPPADAEAINELLQHYRLHRDDITNDVTCANLVAFVEDSALSANDVTEDSMAEPSESRGIPHRMWLAAAETRSVMNVPLRELLRIRSAYPYFVLKNPPPSQRKVWAVENSGVFSSLLDAVPDVPLICTHGQFKLAALKLMDCLVASGCEIYYSGDYDPEGLLMAQRLKERYGQAVHFWLMNPDDYVRSQPNVPLDQVRLSKMDAITEPELLSLAAAIANTGKAGYQEAILPDLIADLKQIT